ncbi:myeloid-derived growth factor [Notechis scutatus]|uniref:Myeloid-derived growth factor n=1 Tax=Notechis scutatus TaxID=8663 RepID=A0A6J1VS57_9SAUR|nr:myeloid-derived growth factor [Notechis scutatus]
MVAPRLLGNRRLWDSWTSFFLLQLLLSAVGAKQEPITADFDVRPGGMVHSYSQNLGEVTCAFTYAAQGGTNESSASVGGQDDVPLKEEEFLVTEQAVSHREGKFNSELSKLMIVAEKSHDEL